MATLTEISRLAAAGSWTIQLSLWPGRGGRAHHREGSTELNGNLNISGSSCPAGWDEDEHLSLTHFQYTLVGENLPLPLFYHSHSHFFISAL